MATPLSKESIDVQSATKSMKNLELSLDLNKTNAPNDPRHLDYDDYAVDLDLTRKDLNFYLDCVIDQIGPSFCQRHTICNVDR